MFSLSPSLFPDSTVTALFAHEPAIAFPMRPGGTETSIAQRPSLSSLPAQNNIELACFFFFFGGSRNRQTAPKTLFSSFFCVFLSPRRLFFPHGNLKNLYGLCYMQCIEDGQALSMAVFALFISLMGSNSGHLTEMFCPHGRKKIFGP